LIKYIKGAEIALKLEGNSESDPSRGRVPAYTYQIIFPGSQTQVGEITLRVGYNQNIYYGGHIGYEVKEKYRGNRFAAKACRLIRNPASLFQMKILYITCNPDNIPSRRTCEILGAELLEIVDLPSENEMYLEGERQKCRYRWKLGW